MMMSFGKHCMMIGVICGISFVISIYLFILSEYALVYLMPLIAMIICLAQITFIDSEVPYFISQSFEVKK